MEARKLMVKVSKELNTHMHTHMQVTVYDGLEANNHIYSLYLW